MTGAGGRAAGGRGRRGGAGPVRRFPRAARINEVLRQVLAEEIERLVDTDDRLTLVTITAVETDRDLRSATLLFSRLGPDETAALGDARIRLQATIARQVKLKWTPLLSFAEDPAIIDGQRVEEILRQIHASEPPPTDPVSPNLVPPGPVSPGPVSPKPVSPKPVSSNVTWPDPPEPSGAAPDPAAPGT